MSKFLRYTFLVHAVVATVLGAVLLIKPGLFAEFDPPWAPLDPLTSRVLGAALLSFAWGSYKGWQAADRGQVMYLVEMEAIFTVLGAAGLLRHLLEGSWPWYVWTLFIIIAIFAVLWLYHLYEARKSKA